MEFYRLNEGKLVAGVCSGIADKYKIDVTLLRLGVVFVTALTGFVPGILTYLVAWFLMPEQDGYSSGR
jgi:phage shock protein C